MVILLPDSNKNLKPSVVIVYCTSNWELTQFPKSFLAKHPPYYRHHGRACSQVFNTYISYFSKSCSFGRHQPPVLMNHIHGQFPYFSPSTFTQNSIILIDSFFKCKWSLCCSVNEEVTDDFCNDNLISAIAKLYLPFLFWVIMGTNLTRKCKGAQVQEKQV